MSMDVSKTVGAALLGDQDIIRVSKAVGAALLGPPGTQGVMRAQAGAATMTNTSLELSGSRFATLDFITDDRVASKQTIDGSNVVSAQFLMESE